MKHRAVIGLVVVLLALASIGWFTRRYVDAFFNHRVGAPSTEETTAPRPILTPPPLRLAVAGDVGTGDVAEYATAARMDEIDSQSDYDALLLLGDNVYPDGEPDDVDERVLAPFDSVLDGETRLLAVLGNHDVRDGNGQAQAAALGMPDRWYSEEADGALLVALDSTQSGNPEQLAWLRTTLERSSAPWTIVFMHHPAYSAGWHGGDRGVRHNFVPVFEQYGVDLVLSGHDHDYQRSDDINGVVYVVSGAAAKLRATGRDDFTAISWSTHNFVDLAIYADRIEGQAIDHNGRAIDTFDLVQD